ncbi:hypothetical protein [Streptomyces viridochromogenes]|uniref:hypothetical protein n=1 Tax=Streptomyces viridochromogenes TaxID=1938 RepID=UPI0001B4FFA8|nr:hypothetical protein [Streptomyces viridochromogenes]
MRWPRLSSHRPTLISAAPSGASRLLEVLTVLALAADADAVSVCAALGQRT